jgi:S1-C subfamily serine protease
MRHDIILKIDGREVTTLDDVRAIHKASLASLQTNHRLVFMVLRNGLARQLVLDLARDYERE